MDYKYIEQLLDRYFECETTLEEEQILRAFFSQRTVPARLLAYRHLFAEQVAAKMGETLGSDFDRRIMAAISSETGNDTIAAATAEPKHVKVRMVSLNRRLRPLYKAAACVAIVLAIGQAAQMPYNDSITEQQEQFARTLDQLQRIQKDQNTVAKGDSVTTGDKTQSSNVMTPLAN